MPTYQYRCTECATSLDVVAKFSDAPLTMCPECQGRLRKVFSPVGVVFKGSGFYKTDSRRSAKAAGGAGSDGAKDAPKTDAAKSDGAAAEGGSKEAATTPAAGSSDGGSSSGGGSSDPGKKNGEGGARKSSGKDPVHKVA